MRRSFISSITLFVVAFVLLQACGNKRNTKPTVSVENNFIHFFEELGSPDSLQVVPIVNSLATKYPYFFRLYTEGLLKIGEVPDSIFPENLFLFLSDPVYNEVLDTVEIHFANTDKLEREVSLAFSYLKSAFPVTIIPDVYWMVSGFNEPIVVGDKLVAVSLEHYLGNAHPFYDQLGIYKYLQEFKKPDRIPYDIMDGWNRTEFLLDASKDRLLDDMLYEGRLLYLLTQVFPEVSAPELLGYSDDQQNWLKKNESAVWTYIVEQKQLFSSDQTIKRKYIGDAPYTTYFGENSPSRIGRYVGYQVVKGFMENNESLSIPSLFELQDSQSILQGSRYNP